MRDKAKHTQKKIKWNKIREAIYNVYRNADQANKSRKFNTHKHTQWESKRSIDTRRIGWNTKKK